MNKKKQSDGNANISGVCGMWMVQLEHSISQVPMNRLRVEVHVRKKSSFDAEREEVKMMKTLYETGIDVKIRANEFHAQHL